MTFTFNPARDLKLERVVPVAPEKIWAAWTQPEHLKKWFCPLPWRAVECEIELEPGGLFRTVMQGPAGERVVNTGCYLEIVPNRRLTWTTALERGFRPADADTDAPIHFFITAMILIEPQGASTKYTAYALHKDEAVRGQHDAMGFRDGWGTALDQLVALAATL